MQKTSNSKLLQRNIKLFGLYKTFTKRVFLPVTTIYATQQAGLNIQQIGLIASLNSLVSFLLDTPTGYFADKYGRKRSAQVGAALCMVASLVYIFSTNMTGILLAALFISAGYSFLTGAMDALVHDSLVLLNKAADYAKVASRAQAVSLIGNAVLISMMPFLYTVDKRLPFVASFTAFMALYGLASLVTEPNIIHKDSTKPSFIAALKTVISRHTIMFFVLAGIVFASGTATADVFNLGLLKLGTDIKFFGIIYAGASILGAIIGFFVHNLKKLSFKQYALFDILTSTLIFICFGIIKSQPLAIASLIVNMAFWRYESIMYQHYILEIHHSSRYKATLISALTNFRSLNEIWMSFSISSLARHLGILNAIGYSTLLFVVLAPFLILSISKFMATGPASPSQ